jgi:RNA polymerase sigma-70 factor (ECF subfamily)
MMLIAVLPLSSLLMPVLTRAGGGTHRSTVDFVETDFARAIDPYRRELLAYCYRVLGSVHDAEDMVQETFLRAWRAYAGYDPARAALRTWLYRIATNVCLTALDKRGRRPMPSGLGGPTEDPLSLLDREGEVPWLQPFPTDPATVVASRAGMRLALIAALQHLPARQRVVLILRDVLAWRAAEVAEFLDTSVASVNSALQRARERLSSVAPAEETVGELSSAAERDFLERYATAFAAADVDALVETLHEDVVLEMPPFATWFAGRDAVARFLPRILAPGGRVLVPVHANGRPGFATYHREADGVFRAHAIQVLTVTAGGVTEMMVFLDPALFPTFGLPLVHGAEQGAIA